MIVVGIVEPGGILTGAPVRHVAFAKRPSGWYVEGADRACSRRQMKEAR
jgi:hypothetical protein